MIKNIGLKISKIGKDVKTATDKDLIFTSKYPALKILTKGYGEKTFTSDTETIELATHGLGYKPFFKFWINTGDGFKVPKFETYDMWYITDLGTSTTNKLYWVHDQLWTDIITPPAIYPPQEYQYAYVIFYDPIKDE